mgnify:CR=1 FL=1
MAKVSISEAARLVNVSRPTLYKMLNNGTLTYTSVVKHGKQVKTIDTSELIGGVSRNPRNFRRKTSSERFSSVLLSDMVCRACFGSSIGPFGALQRCCRKSTVYRQPSPVLALLARRKNLGFGLTTPTLGTVAEKCIQTGSI